MRGIIRIIGNDALSTFRTYENITGADKVVYVAYQKKELF
jgi:hypothetical protein